MGEWYILVSDDRSILDRIRDQSAGRSATSSDFVPVPFGKDLYGLFGNDYSMPVVGNFDPHHVQVPLGGSPSA